jgi:nicotinamidase-related amidase
MTMEQQQKTALLVIDLQAGIVGMLPDKSLLANVLSKVAKAIAHARSVNIPVIYVTVGFRQGAPEINVANKSFGAGKERFGGLDMNEFTKVHPDLAPIEGEIICMKRRVSAFTGSDLEVVLKAFGIQHMVLTGVATSGAILSTTREAADKDYRITILSDGCADGDEEVHRVLTTKVFPRQADVLTVEEWVKA